MKTFEIILGSTPLTIKRISSDIVDGSCEVVNIYTEQKQYVGSKIDEKGRKKYGTFSIIDGKLNIINDFVYDKIVPFYGEEFVIKHYGGDGKTAYVNSCGNVYMLAKF